VGGKLGWALHSGSTSDNLKRREWWTGVSPTDIPERNAKAKNHPMKTGVKWTKLLQFLLQQQQKTSQSL